MKIFDYVYYRLTKFYFKWDGRKGITAILGVSMIQSMLFADVAIILLISIIGQSETAHHSKLLAYSWAILFLIVAISNHYRYKNKFSLYKKRWESESRMQNITRGTGVLFLLILPWIITIGGAILNKH